MDEGEAGALGIDPVVQEAMDRFKRCSEREGVCRGRFIDDIKFAFADSDNGYQWPNSLRQGRESDDKPCLTINVIHQHNLMILNQLRKQKIGVQVKGVGNGATKESADAFQMVVRHIEYQSNAQGAYINGAEFQVHGGYGAWRVVTDWEPGTFDQEIFVRPIRDPLTVYLDPDAQELDGSDSKFGFVFDKIPRKEFDKAFPQFKGMLGMEPLGTGAQTNDFLGEEEIWICEYFRKVPKTDQLVSFVHQGKRKTVKASMLAPEILKGVLAVPSTKTRDLVEDQIEWKLIVGEKVVDHTVWPGTYIPLVIVKGEETVIDGILDRKGHTRNMKDSQRMYNYNASGQVETVALQSKTPWVAPIEAIEEHMRTWATANTENPAVLPYVSMTDDGKPIAAPQRTPPPTPSNAFESGMSTAFNQMMMASGQWQNQMGMLGNERTGTAIQERQEQGDTATFHLADNFASAIRYTGKILVDLIPKVYDTNRLLLIQGDDGVSQEVEIDPGARQGYLETQGHNGEVVKRILNPNIGRYDVVADIGPNLGTRREQTVQALTLILTQAPALTGIIGDLLLQAMDFKEAQDAAQRLKRMVPPMALGRGPTPAEQQLQGQVVSLQQALAKALEGSAKDKLKLQGKEQMRDIDAYDSETKRIAALAKLLPSDPQGLADLISQLVSESLQTSLLPILQANAGGLGNEAEEDPGAQLALPGLPPQHPVDMTLGSPASRGSIRIAPLARMRTARGVVGE